LQAYTCPSYFSDDWLNSYLKTKAKALPESFVADKKACKQAQRKETGGSKVCDGCADKVELMDSAMAGRERVLAADEANVADYQFVYLGLAGSRTHVHADVLRSYSWSINIAGKKRCAGA
jgi:hypothetical protein